MTKTVVQGKVRDIVDPQPMDQEFCSELISDLIAEKHYYCAPHGLRPSAFKKTFRNRRTYDFWGRFERCGWHMVSWRKCIWPPSDEDKIRGALRDRIEPQMAALLRGSPRCATCGSSGSLEVHHSHPTFDEIVRELLKRVTLTEIEDALQAYDWCVDGAFQLPERIRLVHLFDDLHRDAQLVVLCRIHHPRQR